jgi:hypothetical protein
MFVLFMAICFSGGAVDGFEMAIKVIKVTLIARGEF